MEVIPSFFCRPSPVSCLCFHFAYGFFIPCIWFSFLCSESYQHFLLLHLDFESCLGRPSCGIFLISSELQFSAC